LRICAQRGAGPGCNTQEVGEKLTDLKEEISKLEDHEQLLDTHTRWIQQSIKNIENDIINKKYAYITYEDVKENFVDRFVLGIEAPPDTELIVPNVLKVFKKIIRKCLFYYITDADQTFQTVLLQLQFLREEIVSALWET